MPIFSPAQPQRRASPASTTATASTASASCPTPRASGRYATRSNAPALDGKTGGFDCDRAVGRQPRPGAGAQPLPFRLCRRHAVLPLRHHLLRLDAPAARHAGRDAGDADEDRASTRCAWASSRRTTPTTTNEPLHDVYERGADGELDFDRPNPVAFRHFETQVGALRDLGIEADIIIFHPYDRWGYCRHDGRAGLPLRRLPRRAARAPIATSGGRSPTSTTSCSTPSRWRSGTATSTSSRRTIPTGT